MKTRKILKEAARWLLGSQARTNGCSVEGCSEKRVLAVAGDASGTTLMCMRHALAWSESGLCRDIAQHNSNASLAALSEWLSASHAGAEGSTHAGTQEVQYTDVPALSARSVP